MLLRRAATPADTARAAFCDSVRIEAPAELVREVLADAELLASWIGFGSVREIRFDKVEDGRFHAGGDAATKIRPTAERATGADLLLRYRVARGSPLTFHLGEIRIRPRGGDASEVVWCIRFRSRLVAAGGICCMILQRTLSAMLRDRLRPFVLRAQERRRELDRENER